MARAQSATIHAIGAVLLAAGPAFAEEKAVYCVRPVPIVADAPNEWVPRDARIVSRKRQDIEPRYIKLAEGADYPVAYDHYTYEQADGERLNGQLFWSFSTEGQLIGPYETGFMLGTDGIEDRSTTPDRLLLVGGRYVVEGPGLGVYGADGKKWQNRLFEAAAGAAPTAMAPEIQEKVEFPDTVFWSNVLDAFLISVRVPRDSHTSTSKSSLLREGAVTALSDRGVDFAADLPHLGVAAILDSSGLSFVDRSGVVERISPLKSGDDFNGWEALHATHDEGWLYVDGAQYDHTVKIEKSGDGGWQVAKLVRISEEVGFADSVIRWLIGMNQHQMERDRLTEIVRAGQCRVFSKAIGRMIFCDRMEEMRAGELVRIEGPVEFTRFLGDIGYLGLGIFLGSDTRLYSYDGETVRPIPGETVERGIVQELPDIRRSFLATRTAAFEIEGDAAETLKVIRLDVPGSDDLFFMRLRMAPDGADIVAFTRQGIYLVEEAALRPLWTPGDDARIDITGHTVPTEVKGWNGTLFTTQEKVGEKTRFHLLTSCDG